MRPFLQGYTGLSGSSFEEYDKIEMKILVPELVSYLISEDYHCSTEDAYHMAWLSDEYGGREFPFKPDCLVLAGLQKENSRERRSIRKAIEMHEGFKLDTLVSASQQRCEVYIPLRARCAFAD